MKVLCYGVRDVEIEFFKKINENFGFDLTLIPEYLNTKESAELASGYDAVILRGNCFANKENLDIYKKCGVKYVLTRTVGVNHIDIEYAKSLGFKLAYVPFYSPNAIAELAVTHAMMHVRNMALTADLASKKDFRCISQMFSREIRNCTVGIIGLGKIGFTAAKLFKGLGATVLGYDVIKKEGVSDILTQVSLDELIKNSDIISIHIPYIKENGQLVNEDFISKMKENSILINTGRGGVVNTKALINGLKSGKLAGAGLDTVENEANIFFKNFEGTTIPDENFEELVKLYPKVTLSPHVGSFTDQALTNMIEISYDNLKEYIETGECKNCIK